jgi:PHD/YefM family antitoxin component YafN of YafNO toxin-antitoxin module
VPIAVTRNGRDRLVLMSSEEYHRLKRLDREALPVSALTDQELAAIAAAEVPAKYKRFDKELHS